jgi:cold shock CspA family protein
MIKEREMYGEIKKFRPDLGVGIICAEDGRRFRFESGQVLNHLENLEGNEVHFEVGELKARSIIVLAGSPWSAFGSISV